tara:strand:+ start:724 stop:1143 length:420 start_codon:yes stop_codon:yes gene_type:complete
MAGGASRNLRLADWCYEYIKNEGPKSVQELKDYINHQRKNYVGNKYKESKSRTQFSSHQITGMLRTSPLFTKKGIVVNTYDNMSRVTMGTHRGIKSEVYEYDIIGIEKVVDSLLEKKHRFRKHYPNVIKQEVKRRGMEL